MKHFILFDETITTNEKIYFVFILTLFILIYFSIHRLLQWMISREYTNLMSYVISSMFYLNVFFLILLIVNSGHISRVFISYIIQIALLFGLLLTIALSMTYVFRKVARKKAQS